MIRYDESRKLIYDTAALANLNCGELVKIKPLRLVRMIKEKGYDFPGHYNRSMEKYCGKNGRIVDVKRILTDYGHITCYRLDMDGEEWLWSADMFDWNSQLLLEIE